jgi:hypothetical protein
MAGPATLERVDSVEFTILAVPSNPLTAAAVSLHHTMIMAGIGTTATPAATDTSLVAYGSMMQVPTPPPIVIGCGSGQSPREVPIGGIGTMGVRATL